jgi:protein SCO1/2
MVKPLHSPERAMPRPLIAGLLAIGVLASVAAAAQPAAPSPFSRIGFDQRVGAQVPLDLTFRDEQGHPVRLQEFFGRRPVVLSLVYYSCPMLCPLTLNGLNRSVKGLSFDVGSDFQVVVVSIDPKETPAQAGRVRAEALTRYGRRGLESGWHFLTGDADQIARLAKVVGFRYYYDEDSHQYAHASGVIVLTPDGKVSRYFYGIEFPSRSLRLGLFEAADRKIGTVMDQVLLYCFHYDPVQGRYSAATLNLVRAGGVLTVLGLGLMIGLLRRPERHGPKPLGTA